MKKLFIFCLSLNIYSIELDKLTIDEKIGQLFAIAVPLPSPPKIIEKYCETINNYHIGSILLDRKGTIKQQVCIVNTINEKCRIKPLILEDLEPGFRMRLYDNIKFPLTITCGAIQDNNLIYQMAQEIGRQCKILGVDINLAPVLDLNYNASNSLAERSFGKNEENVMNKGKMYITGILSQGIYPCAKHFPGHGDSQIDPHLGPPVVSQTKRQLSVELFPFKRIIDIVPCVMPGHICVPAYDNRPQYYATVSKPITTSLLKYQLNFNGIVISDALRMKALTQSFSQEDIIRESFMAGIDILLCPPDIKIAIQTLKEALKNGLITECEINERVQKILTAKKALGVLNKKNISETDLSMLCNERVRALKKSLYENAITLIKNNNQQIPLHSFNHVAHIQIGGTFDSTFFTELQKQDLDLINNLLPACPAGYDINELIYQLESFDTVIISLMCMNKVEQQQFGISPTTLELIKQIAQLKNVVLVIFGSPYSLKFFEELPTIIMAYEDDTDAQEAAAKIITGELTPKGKLPVSVSEKFSEGLGL